MTNSNTLDRDVTSRSLRRERFEQMFGTETDAAPATAGSESPASPQQFTDPLFAAAAREALSSDSATFLRQARQTRGE
jgi:hypothetical protein